MKQLEYLDDRNNKHIFLLDESKVAAIDYYTTENDGAFVKFLLVTGKVLVLYLGFSNDNVLKEVQSLMKGGNYDL